MILSAPNVRPYPTCSRAITTPERRSLIDDGIDEPFARALRKPYPAAAAEDRIPSDHCLQHVIELAQGRGGLADQA